MLSSASFCASLAAALVLHATLAAQTPASGFVVSTRYATSGVAHDVHAMAASRDGSALWVAHRDTLYSVDTQGGATPVHSLSPGAWIGAIVVDGGSGEVVFSDWSTDTLHAHDPSTGRTRTVGSVPANSFDLVFLPGTTTLLASANPAWPTPGARPGVWRVDPAGNHRELVQLDGVSGPLAFAGNGDLLCATVTAVYPPPPGSSRLLRFAAGRLAQVLAGGPPLGLQDAVAVGGPLDGAYDIVVDDRERAYLSDSNGGQVWRIDLGNGARGAVPILATSAAGTTHLAYVTGTGPATFDAFQRAGGGRLLATVADWINARSEVTQVDAEPPILAAWPGNPVPRGPASVRARGLVANAACVLFVSELASVGTYTALRWQGAPMLFELDPLLPPLAWPAVADGRGDVTWTFQHTGAGGGGATLWLQALSLSPGVGGTSLPLRLQLAP